MKFSTYQIIYKKTYKSDNNLKLAIISYTIMYSLLTAGVIFWDVRDVMTIFMYGYIGLLILNLIVDYSEDRGDKFLIEFFKYTPCKPFNIYIYHYIKKMWFSYEVILDIIIPLIFFFILKIPFMEVIICLIKIHTFTLIVLFLQYLIFWLKKKKTMKITLILLTITFFSINPIIKNLIYPKIKFIFNNPNNLILLTSLVISLCLTNFIIESLLQNKKSGISNSWIKTTNTIANTLTFIFPNNKFKIIINYVIKLTLRNKNLIYVYLLCICFLLVTRTIWNYFTHKNGFELLSTCAIVLSISIFNKIKSHNHLKNALNLSYLPIGDRKKQLIEDIIGLINVLLIWTVLIFDFSLTHKFTYAEIIQCTMLTLCYYIISLGFTFPTTTKSDSKEIQKNRHKKIFKITISFVLIQALASFLITPLIKINLITLLILIPVLLLWAYLRTYKKLKN